MYCVWFDLWHFDKDALPAVEFFDWVCLEPFRKLRKRLNANAFFILNKKSVFPKIGKHFFNSFSTDVGWKISSFCGCRSG